MWARNIVKTRVAVLHYTFLNLCPILVRPQALRPLRGSGAELCLHIRSLLSGMSLLHTGMSPSGVTRWVCLTLSYLLLGASRNLSLALCDALTNGKKGIILSLKWFFFFLVGLSQWTSFRENNRPQTKKSQHSLPIIQAGSISRQQGMWQNSRRV